MTKLIMKGNEVGVKVESISMLHKLSGLKEPANPLISVINLMDWKSKCQMGQSYCFNFYAIIVQKSSEQKIRPIQQESLYKSGKVTFFAPKQIHVASRDSRMSCEGLALMIHPDFISAYSLNKIVRESVLFTKAFDHGLLLSEVEEMLLTGIIKRIENELKSNIDQFTQGLVLSMLEMLLNYCNRFSKHEVRDEISSRNDMLKKMDNFLTDYFNSDELATSGMPSVRFVAERLNISPNYLSDILRVCTGKSTKQHIQDSLIKKAKEALLMTDLTMNEVAYSLGFEYPQSFNKLFKKKTGKTPLEFKQKFNINAEYGLHSQTQQP